MSSDLNLSVTQIITIYFYRSKIEVMFLVLKHLRRNLFTVQVGLSFKSLVIGFLGVIYFLSGCATPQERAPEEAVMLTENYARHPEKSSRHAEIAVHQSRWWETYGNEELNALIDESLVNNPGINQTRKRLEQAAAAARRTLSDLFPDLSVSGERETTRGDGKTPSTFSLRGAAGYELDIWGGNYAGYKSDNLETEASIEDIRTAAITLSASIVENWLRLLALWEEEVVLNEQIEINQMVLDLQYKRYANGIATVLDVLQQKELLARAHAQLPDIESEQEIVLHQIAVLAGKTPSAPLSLTRTSLPEILPLPDTGIPSRLLVDRPDIAAAWLRVLSADWAAKAAWAERLPGFDISSTHASTSTALDTLLNTWLLNLVAGLALPVIDGGERRAEEARQKALADERLQAYKETVLNAIAEVEDVLTLNYHQANKIKAVKDQLTASRNSLEQAQISYANGEESYLSVLNGLLNVQTLERQLVQERRALALNRVALYRAIGLRSWTDSTIR
jgi:NodT family efflux transporter outer membrane factor (OMF) lipoprotein